MLIDFSFIDSDKFPKNFNSIDSLKQKTCKCIDFEKIKNLTTFKSILFSKFKFSYLKIEWYCKNKKENSTYINCSKDGMGSYTRFLHSDFFTATIFILLPSIHDEITTEKLKF